MITIHKESAKKQTQESWEGKWNNFWLFGRIITAYLYCFSAHVLHSEWVSKRMVISISEFMCERVSKCCIAWALKQYKWSVVILVSKLILFTFFVYRIFRFIIFTYGKIWLTFGITNILRGITLKVERDILVRPFQNLRIWNWIIFFWKPWCG